MWAIPEVSGSQFIDLRDSELSLEFLSVAGGACTLRQIPRPHAKVSHCIAVHGALFPSPKVFGRIPFLWPLSHHIKVANGCSDIPMPMSQLCCLAVEPGLATVGSGLSLKRA